MTPYSKALTLAAKLPQAQLLDIPECGHMLLLEKPEEVHTRLLSAIKS